MDTQQLTQKVLRAVARRPHTAAELQNNLQVPGAQLRTVLAALAASGQVVRQGGQYTAGQSGAAGQGAPAGPAQGIPCVLSKLAPRFGFAAPEDGTGEIFIPGRFLLGAMPRDRVLVRLLPPAPGAQREGEKRSGEVVAVTVPQARFAGTVLYDEEHRLAVEPDGCPGVAVPLAPGQAGGAKPGDKVGARLAARGARHAEHRAAVEQCFGAADCAAHCAGAVLYRYGVRQAFPPEVLAEASALPEAVDAGRELAAGTRADLRGVPVFTVDSAATRDIDDAVSVRTLAGGGFELGVHIADVSHYVRPGTALDAEAQARATSIYYADTVIPMLPARLSNGLCSLNEGADRLAFSCLMELDAAGRLTGYHFVKSVIRSRVKGVYGELNLLLDGSNDPALLTRYAAVAGQLPALRALYEKRLALRRARGGMELDSPEAKLVLDAAGRCVGVRRAARGAAEAMIEECMLLANQCAAAAGRGYGVPFVYRVHEPPDAARAEKLRAMLRACGLPAEGLFRGAVPTQRELAALLERTRGQPAGAAVHTAVLRSMQKARYAPQPLGHYGLALADYAHFTSPIRRYPDLAVHRILTDRLRGAGTARLVQDYTEYAAHTAAHATAQEGTAAGLEREMEAIYKAEYMRAHLGEAFAGTVSGVTPRGVFVQLENTVEGFVPAAQLCQGEPEMLEGVCLRDPLTGRTWRLGDAMRVRAEAADVALGQVDLLPLDGAAAPVVSSR